MLEGKLIDTVRQTAYEIHVYHGHGYLEKVYENAMAHRLRKLGIQVEQQVPSVVHDEDGTPLGECFVDLLIEKSIILELKCVKSLAPEHTAQILNYMKASRVKHGMLINFGSYKFQVRKFVL